MNFFQVHLSIALNAICRVSPQLFWGTVDAGSSHAMTGAGRQPGHSHAVNASELDKSDLADVQETINGSHDAYRRLVERNQQEIGRFLWKFTRDRSEWEELLQTVFVEAYMSLSSFRRDARLIEWLKGIATNIGYKFWTTRRQLRSRIQRMPEGNDPAGMDPSDCEFGLFELMSLLSPRDRLVLTLLYVEERTVADTARITGWSESMVKSQSHRARSRLKGLWNENEQ